MGMGNGVRQYQQSAICDTDYTDDYMVIARHAEMKKHSLYNAYLLDIAKNKGYSTKLTDSYLTALNNCQKDMTTVVDKKMGTYYHTYGFRCRRNFCWGCMDKKTNILYRNTLKAVDEYLFNNPSSQFNVYMSTFSLDYVDTMEEAVDSLKRLDKYMKKITRAYSNLNYTKKNGAIIGKGKRKPCMTLAKIINDDLGFISSLELSYKPNRGFKPHMHINVIADINTHITGQEMDDLFMYASGLKKNEFYSFTEETHADKLDFDFAKQIALISSYTIKGFLIDFQKTGMSTDEQAKSAGVLFDFLFKKNIVSVLGKIFNGQRIRSKTTNTTGRHEHKLLNQIGIRENGLNENEYDDIVKEFEGQPVQENDITDNVSIDESGILPRKEDLKNDKFISVGQAARKYAQKLNISKTINIPKHNQNLSLLNTYTKDKIQYEQQVLWNFDDNKLSFIAHTSKNDLNRVLSMRILKVKNMCRDFAEKQKKILNEKHPMLFEHIVERAKVSYMKDKIMKHFHMDTCIKYIYNSYENVYLKSSKVDYTENGMILNAIYYNTFISHEEYNQMKNEWLNSNEYTIPNGYFCRSSKHTKMSKRFIKNK